MIFIYNLFRAYHPDNGQYSYIETAGSFAADNMMDGDFNALQNLINGALENSIITLYRNYTFTDGSDDNLVEGIVIKKTITIDGNGYTINAKNNARTFNITDSAENVVLKNIDFANVKSNFYGSIYWEGNYGSLVNCRFTDCCDEYDYIVCGCGGFGEFINVSFMNARKISSLSVVYNGTDCYIFLTGQRNYEKTIADFSIYTFVNVTIWNEEWFDHSQRFENQSTVAAGQDIVVEIYSGDDLIENVTLVSDGNGRAVYYVTLGNGDYNYNVYHPNNLYLSYAEATGNFTVTGAPEGDFNRLQAYIDRADENTTISLYRNYTFTDGFDDNLAGGIVINKTITIDGNGYTIDANRKGRIFYITEGAKVVLKNIIFINGNADGSGGAIYWSDSNANIINCYFANNTASHDCGAIYLPNNVGDSYINATFANNLASMGNGGAIMFNGSLSNALITGTYVNNSGKSLIYIKTSDESNVIKDSIFINNEGVNILVESGSISVIDNWFGNTALNYDVTPNVNVNLDNWLFLNATADLNTLYITETSNITFRLYVYNPDSGVSEYNGSLRQPIELSLYPTGGEVDRYLVGLNEVVNYAPKSFGEGSVTASFENLEYRVEFNIVKFDSNLSAEGRVINYGENATITLDYHANATGKVNITLTGKKHNKTYENLDLNAAIVIPDVVLPDEYEVTVNYGGDDNFMNATAMTTLTVNKLTSDIKIISYDLMSQKVRD
jgi:hypothetical protein